MAARSPDLKAWDDDQPSEAREWFYGKMTRNQWLTWRRAYDDKNQRFYDSELDGEELARWKYQRYLQDYLACVLSVDESVGAILDYLESNDLSQNTVVIYCSDQGFFLGEHGWFDKRFMYEPSLRTPLLIQWPGQAPAGKHCSEIVSNLDFARTILQMAQVPAPAEIMGRSFVPLLQGSEPSDWRNSFYYHYYEGADAAHHVCEHYGVTDGTHKLIHYYKIDEWELFDLAQDPEEIRNLYGKPDAAELQSKLLVELRRLQRKHGVPAYRSDAPGEAQRSN